MIFSELLHDLNFAIRSLLRSRGFTLIALGTLGVGIGANTAIFSFVDGVLLKAPPFPESDRIALILEKHPTGASNGVSTLNYLDWAQDNTVFDFMASYTGGSVTLTGGSEPEEIPGMRVSAHYFDIFQIRPALGRTFQEGDDRVGNDHVVVVSNRLWRSQFGGDPGIVGRTILLNGEPNTVIGVLPADSPFERDAAKLWRPLAFTPENKNRNYHWLGSVGKLKAGVTVEQAQSNMDTIGARIAADYPDSNQGWGVVVVRYAEAVVKPKLRQSIVLLMGAVGMVLLIGCANLANLMLVRGLARSREVSIRSALGAGRWRLMRQFLTESLFLSALGGALGVGVAFGLMNILRALVPEGALPREAAVSLDLRVLSFAVALSVLTGVVCGLFPALQATRRDLLSAMKQASGGASTASTRNGVRSSLVVAEVALAFLLLTGAGLLLRSFQAIQSVDTGFDSSNVFTAKLPVAEQSFSSPDLFRVYLRSIVDRVRTIPGVQEVALTSALPLQGWGYGMPFQIAEQPPLDPSKRPVGYFKMVTPSYFSVLKLTMIKGRPLDSRDGAGAPPAVVINQSLAKNYFPHQDPIGKRVLVAQLLLGKTGLGAEIPWEIVGVVADEKVGLLAETEGTAGMYVTTEQSPQREQALLVRTAIDPPGLADSVRKAVHEVNRDQSISHPKTLETIKRESMGDSRLRAALLAVFALVALLLSTIGIYGVISYTVVQQTREIGIRTALGASAGTIRWLILGRGLRLVCLGLVLGLGGVFALTRLLQSMLFEVGERDPLTLAIVGLTLIAVGLMACFWPARRAARLAPIVALRHD